MHEGGHGLSYQGIAPELARSPLYGNASHGIGESQSRTWENLVGRSLPFWRGFYPEVQRRFPHLASVGVDDFYRGVNRVERGLIRVEADEVTYSLHIIVRFELEQQLVAGTLEPEDLPEAWSAKMAELLGVDVPDDLRGVLQDVHWTRPSYGYFPTYALGNVLSVQIWRGARGGAFRSRRAARVRRARRRCTRPCAGGSTATAASSRRSRRSSARSARRRSTRSRTSRTCARRSTR